MIRFNLEKFAEKSSLDEPYPKRLERQTDEYNRNYGKPQTIQSALRKEENSADHSTTTENLLSEDREDVTSGSTIENRIGTRESYVKHRRHDNKQHSAVKPNDLLAEAYDQKRSAKLKSATNVGDTDFWDEFINNQLSGNDKTTIVSQIGAGSSQLQNHPDRFKNMARNSMPDPETVDDTLKKNRRQLSSTASAVKEVDKELFQIFYKAAKAERDLTSKEQAKVDFLNGQKEKILREDVQS